MIKAVIFDCFGVVISDGLEAMVAPFDKKQPEVRDFIRRTIRRSNSGLAHPAETGRVIAKKLGLSAEEYRRQISRGEVKNQTLITYIETLRLNYKTALLSNVGKDSLHRRFDEGELEHLFDVVMASGEVGMVKPDPGIYKLTAERLDVRPTECVFIDDREMYVGGARKIGMQAILYEDFAQMKRDLEQILKT